MHGHIRMINFSICARMCAKYLARIVVGQKKWFCLMWRSQDTRGCRQAPLMNNNDNYRCMCCMLLDFLLEWLRLQFEVVLQLQVLHATLWRNRILLGLWIYGHCQFSIYSLIGLQTLAVEYRGHWGVQNSIRCTCRVLVHPTAVNVYTFILIADS
jgi:hypothetical protein